MVPIWDLTGTSDTAVYLTSKIFGNLWEPGIFQESLGSFGGLELLSFSNGQHLKTSEKPVSNIRTAHISPILNYETSLQMIQINEE